MTEDNWEHRNVGIQCATCMWFAEKIPDSGIEVGAHRDKFGRCRRRAPTMNGYPAVFGTDWCGDHKMDENKVTR